MALQEFYTAKELAAELRVTVRTISRLQKAGQLKGYRVGRSKRFRRDDIEAFLARCR